MVWAKKAKSLKGCHARIDGLEKKRAELSQELERIKRRVAKHENEVEEYLGHVALGTHPTGDQKELDGCRRLLATAQENQKDVEFQITFVDRELKRLAVEADQATVAEVPEEMQRVASEYNAILDQAMEALPVLQGLHEKALELESKFHALSNSRQNSMSRLGKTEGLELKEGLGRLALTPSPHGFVFRPGGNVPAFVGALQGYSRKLADYAKFKEANPEPQAVEPEVEKPLRPFRWLPERWLS